MASKKIAVAELVLHLELAVAAVWAHMFFTGVMLDFDSLHCFPCCHRSSYYSVELTGSHHSCSSSMTTGYTSARLKAGMRSHLGSYLPFPCPCSYCHLVEMLEHLSG